VTDRRDLPTDATGADILWYPGRNATPCRTWHTSLGGPASQALADDLRSVPDPPTRGGIWSCPADDESFVQIWFTNLNGTFSYRVGLAGCRFDLPEQAKLMDFGPWPEGMPRRD
jgi:hypothetical protein